MIRLALLLALLASPAAAQAPCLPYSDVAEQLGKEFGEMLAGSGLSRGMVMQIWIAPDSGTWTALMIRPSGVACIVASGTDWGASLPEPKGVKG